MSKVYQAINAVQADLARDGISKDRRNQQQGYSFRGIDDVYNALAPLLAKHKLCILPRILRRECTERQTAKGGALFNVIVEAEFDLIASEDGSSHTIRTFGEAMDSADKATNKAMSAAYKYAAMQAFAIPTEGDNDADSTTPEVASKSASQQTRPVSSDDFPGDHDTADDGDASARFYIEDFKRRVEAAKTEASIREMWRVEGPKRRELALTEIEVGSLLSHMKARFDALHQVAA